MRSLRVSSVRLHALLVRASKVKESQTNDDCPARAGVLVAQPLLSVRVLPSMIRGYAQAEKPAQPRVAVLPFSANQNDALFQATLRQGKSS